MGWHRIRMWGWVVWGVCLAGCSASDRIQEPKNTIHYYQFSLPRDRAGLTSLLDRFHLDHPDIRVQLHTLPTSSDDQHQFYLTHATGEGTSRIDVLAVDVIWLAEFARAGLLLPVDDLFEASQWRQFFGSSVQAATYEGVRYAVPFFIDGGLLYSRKDLLEKHGYDAPPRTFPELVRMARTILDREDDPDLQGFVWQGKQYEGLICNFIEFLPGDHRPLIPPGAQQVHFDQPAVRRGLRFMRDLVFKHRVSPESVFSMSEEESRQVFQNGKAIFMRNWPYAWRLAQQAGSPVAGQVQVSPLPAFETGGRGRGALGGFLLGINAQSPYPEAARKWVRFLAGPVGQTGLWEHLGLTPARQSLFPELTPRGFPLKILETVMQSTHPRPVTPVYSPVSQSLQAYISGVLVGVYAPERAVRLVESDTRRIMRILKG